MALAVVVLAGCKSKEKEKILPTISGKAGEVAVVCSKVEWESEPGSTIRALLAAEVPYLPQVEPMYDLFNVPQQAFNKVFQVHRNIIIINTDKKIEKPRFVTWTDVWASPQLVIQIDAPDGLRAAEVVAKQGNKILALLERNSVHGNLRVNCSNLKVCCSCCLEVVLSRCVSIDSSVWFDYGIYSESNDGYEQKSGN